MQLNEFLSFAVDQLTKSHAYNDDNQNWSKFVIYYMYMYLQNTVPLAYIKEMARDTVPYL